MPSRQVKGEYRDICFPCTPEFKQSFDQAVLDAYWMELDQGFSQRQNGGPEQDGPEMGGMSCNRKERAERNENSHFVPRSCA